MYLRTHQSYHMVCVFILKGCRRFSLKLHCWVRAFFRFRMLEMLTKGVLFTLLPLSPLGHWRIKYPTRSHKSRTTGCRPEPPASASGSWWAPSLNPTRRPTVAPKKSSQRQALAKETWDSDTSYNVSGCVVFFFNVLSNIEVVQDSLSFKKIVTDWQMGACHPALCTVMDEIMRFCIVFQEVDMGHISAWFY